MNAPQVTKERLERWALRLAEENSTPLLLLGVGHDHTEGQLTILTCEGVTDEFLAGILRFALRQFEAGTHRTK